MRFVLLNFQRAAQTCLISTSIQKKMKNMEEDDAEADATMQTVLKDADGVVLAQVVMMLPKSTGRGAVKDEAAGQMTVLKANTDAHAFTLQPKETVPVLTKSQTKRQKCSKKCF